MSKNKLKKVFLEEVLLKSVKPYKKNPRKNDQAVAEVVRSIKSVGYRTPITVDEKMVILTGHTRYKALLQMGWKKIPFVIQFTDMPEKKKDEYRIRDNKSGEFATWDMEILTANFTPRELIKFGFDKIETESVTAPEVTYADLEKKTAELAGKEEAYIGLVVPVQHKEKLLEVLSAEFGNTPYGLGQGVLKLCGLL